MSARWPVRCRAFSAARARRAKQAVEPPGLAHEEKEGRVEQGSGR